MLFQHLLVKIFDLMLQDHVVLFLKAELLLHCEKLCLYVVILRLQNLDVHLALFHLVNSLLLIICVSIMIRLHHCQLGEEMLTNL